MYFSTRISNFGASYNHAALATQLCAYFADFKGGTDGAVYCFEQWKSVSKRDGRKKSQREYFYIACQELLQH